MFKQGVRVYGLQPGRTEDLEAWVDSGSTYTWLPGTVLRRLGVLPTGQREFILADGTRIQRDIAQLRIQIGPTQGLCVLAVGQDFPRLPRTHKPWLEMVESEEVDAIAIGTWPYMHCRVTLAALNHGKHVFTEARMAMNAAEARAAFDNPEQTGGGTVPAAGWR